MSNKTTKIKEVSGGNRTPDLLITNQLLCRLSYTSDLSIILGLKKNCNAFVGLFVLHDKVVNVSFAEVCFFGSLFDGIFLGNAFGF